MAKIARLLGIAAIDGVSETHEVCVTRKALLRTACGIPVEVEDSRGFVAWLEENHSSVAATCIACNANKRKHLQRETKKTLNRYL
jgi:hypothetical protein